MSQPQCVPELVNAGEVNDALAEERVASGALGNVGAKRSHVRPDVDRSAEPPVDDDSFHLAVLTFGRFSPIEPQERRCFCCRLESNRST